MCTIFHLPFSLRKPLVLRNQSDTSVPSVFVPVMCVRDVEKATLSPAVTTRSRSSKPIGPFQVENQASISRRASFGEPPLFCRGGARSKERKPSPPCASSRSTFLA